MTLIISLSGRKQAGKNTACNFIVSEFLKSRFEGWNDLYINPKNGYIMNDEDYDGVDEESDIFCKQVTDQFVRYGVKVYSFADPLKRFCIDVLGVPEESCYGTDEQKNTPIPHLLWDNLPKEIVPYITKKTEVRYTEFSGVHRPSIEYDEYKTGPMTGREVMQIFGTEVCRKFYSDCWAMGTMNAIKRDGLQLALVCDGRFPNEIECGKKFDAKVVRLLRKISEDNHSSEIALDDYPLDNYDLVVDNNGLSINETCQAMSKKITEWMKNI